MRTALLAAIFFSCTLVARSQTPPPASEPKADSLKVVQILSAERYGFNKRDSTRELLLLVGNVALKQENTLFYADSAVYNRNAKIVEAFGNVHINDNDTIDTYSDYLLYHTDTRQALLKKNVRLTDGKSNLYTEELEYDVNQKIGIYRKGGKVINNTSTLTSEEGTYYADIKDVYFKYNVDLVDPQYRLKTDSLLYNTNTEVATFIAETNIEDSAKRTIVTRTGFYDLKNKMAVFGGRPIIKDGAATVIANDIDTDDNTGISILTGNAIYKDTVEGVSLLANSIVSDKNTGSLLATQKPLMIIKQDNDSTFITADTLYSGRLSQLKAEQDSLARLAELAARDSAATQPSGVLSGDSLRQEVLAEPELPLSKDSTRAADTSAAMLTAAEDQNGTTDFDSSFAQIPNNSSADTATTDIARNAVSPKPDTIATGVDSINLSSPEDAIASNDNTGSDTTAALALATTADTARNDSAARFFRAYHNVRIFSDSLQAVCDSLFYSGADSMFRLFRDPIVWSGESQVTGDTIYMQTQNKKPHEMYVFENGLMVNRTGRDMYNQIKGTRIFGYFKGGDIDYIRARGNAESIYYAKDSEDKLVGINKASSDIIDMRFKDKELNRVVFMRDVTGTMLPLNQATEQDKKLRSFKWHEDRRPKSKFELFGN